EQSSAAPGPLDLRDRAAEPRSEGEDREERREGEDEPEAHQRRGLEVLDRDLDEQVRRPPGGGQNPEQDDVAAHPAQRNDEDPPRLPLDSIWLARPLELRCSPPVAPRARPHGRGVRPYRDTARAPAERLRGGGLLAALVGALRLQALGAPAQALPHGGCR